MATNKSDKDLNNRQKISISGKATVFINKWAGCYIYTDQYRKPIGRVKFGVMSGTNEKEYGDSPRLKRSASEADAQIIILDNKNFKTKNRQEACDLEHYIKFDKMKSLRVGNSEWYEVGLLKSGEPNTHLFYKYYDEFVSKRIINSLSLPAVIKMTGEQDAKLQAAIQVIPTFLDHALSRGRIHRFSELVNLIKENKSKWSSITNSSIDIEDISTPEGKGKVENIINKFYEKDEGKYFPTVIGAIAYFPEPDSLVKKMLDKLPANSWKDKDFEIFDPAAGTGSILTGAANKFDKNLSIENDFNRMQHISKRITGWDNHEGLVRIMNKNIPSNNEVKDSLVEKWPDKENMAIVFNPPYEQGLCLKFLKKAIDSSARYIVYLGPEINFTNPKENKRDSLEVEIKESIKNKVVSMEIVDGLDYFKGPDLRTYLVIIYIDKSKNNPCFELKDSIKNNTQIIDNIYSVPDAILSDVERTIRKKILTLAEKDNFFNHLKEEKEFPYYIHLSTLQPRPRKGDLTPFGKPKFFSKNPKSGPIISKNKLPPKKYQNLGFSNEEQAKKCYKACGTKTMRYALGLNKKYHRIDRGELKTVPWLDWSKEWDDNNLKIYFNLTREEIKHIFNKI
jgi:hypothetical protein